MSQNFFKKYSYIPFRLLPLIALLLFASNVFSPQIGFILTFFLPLIVITYLNGRDRDKKSDVYNLVALAIAAFYSPIIAFYFILIVAIPALLLYYDTIAGKKLYPVIISGIPIFIVTVVALLALPEYRQLLHDAIVQNIDAISKQIQQNNVPLEERGYIAYIANNKEKIAQLGIFLLPCLSYSYTSLLSFVSRNFAYKFRNLPIKLFKVPDILIIPFLVGGFLILTETTTLKMISYNSIVIFSTLFFFQGLDLVNFFMQKFNIFVFVRLLVYIIIFSEPFMLAAVALFGLFDNWFHFDEMRLKKDKK
ncbi:MAG: DUF2232 domain-containing protein [Flexistipes sinusarabici]|uniref:DUF2232 domain-containing protein n=1 Tax=Flexistipes sinusarabici TaxID=2352 RepID=A0A5D0MP18_FLESI|nr:DUF2232 domain-containing protein [Flexistipes sinusarabici]TYB32369.1 MAG: DUF2232 domain-containing protein [Flexistipes sinusarabici]